jgi:GNAT superfamily N-acetyltransferase
VSERIRPGGPADAELVAKLHATTELVAYAHIFPGQPYPMDDTRRRWREFTGTLLIAELDGRPVGFAACEDDHLHALYVLPDAAGHGIGGRLLAAAGPVTRLWVLRDNHRGRRFYERHGWHPDGTARTSHGVTELQYRRQQG